MKQQLLRILLWTLSGAIALTLLMLLQTYLSGQPLHAGGLVLPALLGSLGGFALGRSNLRKEAAHRHDEISRRQHCDLCEKTPAMLHTIDREGVLVSVNQAWLDGLGYKRQAVLGQDFFNLIITDNPIAVKKQHFDNLREHGGVNNTHCKLRKADGGELEVSITEIAQFNDDGEMTESMAVISDLASYRAVQEKVERLAYFDTLTGLPNRVLLNDRMLQSIAQARRDNRQLGVFFFDLDRFKAINDTQGHATGDLVLRSVAQRLKKFIREGDTFSRLGGDEFVIIQADPNHDPNFTTMARRILETLNEPFYIDGREFYTTASIGVSIYPVDGEDPQALQKSADTAMYVAKSRGRNNFKFFSGEMNAAAQAKSNLENNLRRALAQNTLQQYYQTQVDVNTGMVIGVEALLRWQDDQDNVIPPAKIIRLAEECGLIYALSDWSLKAACKQARTWLDMGLQFGRMAVNLSGHHVRQANFIDQIEDILGETRLQANCLEIELAETSVMSQINDIIMALTDLKVRGISLAIDDFGTGYSSLLDLMHFPIHRIKIAREFIADIEKRRDYTAITEAILAMASSLNLKVIAVGVETAEQVHFLQKHGCTEVQGNYFSDVISADEMTQLLTRQQSQSGETRQPTDLYEQDSPTTH